MRNLIIAFVLIFVASSQSALADQKKKGGTKPITTTSDIPMTGILVGRSAPTKTGPTVPPKPTQGHTNK
jgi:hypothetical protein